MAGLALVVSIVGDARKLQSALGDAGKGVEVFGKQLDVGSLAMGAGIAGAAVVAGKALVDMTMAAAADRDEQEKLATAIRAAGAETATSTQQVEDAIAAGQARAFTDSQTREALQSLVTATGDVTTSTALLSTAQDVARFAGVDLATAADAVAKAQAGQDMQLARLIPGLQKGATATDTIANAQKIAAGQADAYAASTEGTMARASDAMSELGETIGSALLPLLDALLPALIPIISALGELIKAVLPVLIPLIKFVAQTMAQWIGVLVKIVGYIVDLVNAIKGAIDWLGRLANSVPHIDLPGPFGTAPGTMGATTRGVTTTPAPVTVNVWGGDPTRVEQAVARALRGYTRRNGSIGLAGSSAYAGQG